MERRDFLRQSGLTLTCCSWAVYAFPSREGEVLIPFTDQPPESSSTRVLLDWNDSILLSRRTINSSTSRTTVNLK